MCTWPQMTVLMVAAVAATDLFGAVRIGDNLLANPIFESDQLDVPGCWNLVSGAKAYVWKANGGPRALPAVTFDAGRDPSVKAFSLRQGGFALAKGGRYRLSGQVRAKGFSARGAGAVIANVGWSWSTGVHFENLGTKAWTPFSEEIVVTGTSRDDSWTLILYADDFKGRIEFADLSVTPVDAASAAGARLSDKAEAIESPRLVPVAPLLSEIPSDRRRIVFRYFGRLPSGSDGDYEVRVTVGEKSAAAPLTRTDVEVALPPGASSGTFEASVVRRADGEIVFSRRHRFRVVDLPKNPTRGVRLNNLVEEYVRRPLKKGGSGTLPFAFDRRLWLFVSGDAERIAFDGREIIDRTTPRHEAFVEADVGRHELSVTGAAGGDLIVRRIPEIFDYQTTDAAFQRRYVFPSVTTLGSGNLAAEDAALFRKTGHLRIGGVGTSDLRRADELPHRIAASKYVANPTFDGVSCDEQGPWKAKMMSEFAKALWELPERDGFRVYSWVVGKPYAKAPNTDLIAAVANVSGGRGRFMNEIYCRTKPTEDEARRAVRDWLVGNYRAWKALSPIADRTYAPIFGNFTKVGGGWVLSPHAEVDFRCLLDIAMNILANDPELVDLPMTGNWGSAYADYCDGELRRWTFELLRHYFVEGRRDLLSRRHGLKYLPGFLRNNDFADGLQAWTASGTVATDRIAGFGDAAESRGGREKLTVGDTFAVLTKTTESEASVSQRISGLASGCAYVVDFLSFYVQDAHSKNTDGRRTGLSVRVEGGTLLPERTSARVVDFGRHPKKEVRVNCHSAVFVADRKDAILTIATTDETACESVGLNNVGLRKRTP